MKRGGISDLEPVRENVFAGRALLWLAAQDYDIKAVAVTQLVETDKRRICEIVACGGRGMKDWISLIEGLEKYGRGEGCSSMRITGRKGWLRVLKDYKMHRVILERPL